MSRLTEIVAERVARRRELREELGPLEADVATDEMQKAARVEALHTERQGVEQRLRHARGLAPREPVDLPGVPESERPSGALLVARLTARLRAIDEEMERASG
jgi:hydroxypyruvate isomerase